MATSVPKIKVEFKVFLELNEVEARALDALVGYGYDDFEKFFEEFVEQFYSKLGKHYMVPYKEGLRSLFESVRDNLCPQLRQIDHARSILEKS